MDDRVETGREFWRAVLRAGGATAIPRWTLDPAPDVAEHVATLDDDLAAGVRRLAYELELPLHSVALAAHAKVLAALSGEQDVVIGYAARPGGRPLSARSRPKPAPGGRCRRTPLGSSRTCYSTGTSRWTSSSANWAWPGRAARRCRRCGWRSPWNAQSPRGPHHHPVLADLACWSRQARDGTGRAVCQRIGGSFPSGHRGIKEK